MKRFFAALLALPLLATQAFALDVASIPPKFPLAWGNSAGSAYIRSIPTGSQIGIQNCAASLTDGFPPNTFVPSNAGGCPPFGQDFNGILKQVTQWNQWNQAGGPVFYDSAFAASIGGYPNGAILTSTVTPGRLWMSTADNNTGNPDDLAANWIASPVGVPIATPMPAMSSTVLPGYVAANGRTIGNASSNGTNRANGDTKFLFVNIWNNCANTVCPIFTSGGVPSTRGADPIADFNANKAIQVWNMNGAALMGADSQDGTTTAFLTGVPAVIGTRLIPGSILGENLHQLTVGELATHNHTLTDPGHFHSYSAPAVINSQGPGGAVFASAAASNTGTSTTGITLATAGSNTPHNTVARSTIVYWNLKL